MYRLDLLLRISFNFFDKQNLTYYSFFKKFYNINHTTILRIMRACGLNYIMRPKNLIKSTYYTNLYFIIRDKYYINFMLIKYKRLIILKTFETYNGLRYKRFLPVRGQRTKTNAKTRKKYHIE